MEERTRLSKDVLPSKVHDVVFKMGAFKAPGPDGWSPLFFQNQWNVVGDLVVACVKDLFKLCILPSNLNNTILVLIPKYHLPTSFTGLRPISLCNVAYKVITILIANRLKPMMERWVSRTQSNFVSGRSLADNTIIVKEVLHSTRERESRMDGNKDRFKESRLRWSFIQQSLEALPIPALLQHQIMSCISTSRMQVLWNRGLADSFLPSRGIRQGDYLSLYLFVLCMEVLLQGIQKAVTGGTWKGI
ncbi:hypothetical protein Scep_012665 [Stephania cephalantha]|uniref:Reverse transcriptase domain-containing protein n=1 Tax=Stephania cephalantha TaxID=152367 RepID=A0AAP0JFY6_9MAGN